MRTTILKSVAVAFAAALTVGGLAGCSGTDSNEPPAAGGGSDGPYHIIFTAGSTLVTDWDVYVAEDEGFFKKHNVEVENVTTETAEGANKLIITGGAQVARGLAPMIQSIAGSGGALDLIDVADTLVRPPFFMNVNKSITSTDQLKGKKIGTSSPTDNTTIVTIAFLDHLGMTPDDVELTTAGGTSARFAGLQSKALDASLLFPPVAQTAISEGFPSLGYVPDLMGDDFKYAFSGVIMNPKWIKDNTEATHAYLAARNDALKFLNDPANKDRAIEILADATDVDVKAATDTYNALHIGTPQSAFAQEIGIDTDAVNGTLSILQKIGQAPADMKVEDLVDPTAAEAARG